jgi:hypothetical protein
MPFFIDTKLTEVFEALFLGQDSPLVILGAYFAKSKLNFKSADLGNRLYLVTQGMLS